MEKKVTWITLRVSEELKKQIEEDAEKSGFTKKSTFLVWFYKNFRKKLKKI